MINLPPKGEGVVVRDNYYKVGVHGKVFRWTNEDWILTTTVPKEDVLMAYREREIHEQDIAQVHREALISAHRTKQKAAKKEAAKEKSIQSKFAPRKKYKKRKPKNNNSLKLTPAARLELLAAMDRSKELEEEFYE